MLYLGLTNALFFLRYALADSNVLRRKLYFPVLLGLFLFSAFRFQVGCDWSGYYYQYLRAENMDWSLMLSNREPIWWAILGWINYIDLPYPVANIVSSSVFFIGVHVLARRQPDPLGFLVLLFPILIINMPMSGVRQGAAIGLICIAFTAFIDRRPMWFALWVVLAAGFHASSLIFLLLLPVATGRYTKSRLISAVVLALPGLFFLSGENSTDIAINRYLETDREAFGAVFRVGFLVITALYFFLFVRKKWMRYFPSDYSLVSIGSIGMMVALILLPVSSIISDRFGYYFIPVQAIIFSRLPFLYFKVSRSLHSAFPYVIFVVFLFFWTQLSSHFQRCYMPYGSWLLGLPSSDLLR